MRIKGTLPVVIALALAGISHADEGLSWRGELRADLSQFADTTAVDDERTHPAFWASGRGKWTDTSGQNSAVLEASWREDTVDASRDRSEVREAWLRHEGEGWHTSAGIRQIYWGVVESRHLVNVINSSDFAERFDGETRLGQPLLNVGGELAGGQLDVYLLPYFREPTQPELRFRAPLPIAGALTTYANQDGRQHRDWAFRWQRSIDNVDVGVTGFQGTARDPRLTVVCDPQIWLAFGQCYPVAFAPIYEQSRQLGLDAVGVFDALQVKVEALARARRDSTDPSSRKEINLASVTGLEYTWSTPFQLDGDVGLVLEYMLDQEKAGLRTPFQKDVAAGVRLTLNDVGSTSLLALANVDMDKGTRMVSVEASTRFGEHWRLAGELWLFQEIPALDPLTNFRNDDHVLVSVSYFF